MVRLGRASARSRSVLSGVIAALLLGSAALSAGAVEPKRGGTLTVGLAQDPPIVDPIRTGSFTERQFATPVYEALFDIDAKGQAVPFLAESYTVSEDARTYRVKLRAGIKFHDGTPLDADAVLANFDRTRNPANGCRCLSFVQEIEAVTAVDKLTVELKLKTPNAAFPTILADAPGVMVSPTAFKADPTGIGTKPVGTGPFKFVEWIRGSRYVLTRNADYWRPGRPYLDQLVFRGIQNTETLEAAFLSGQTDIIIQPSHRFVAQMKKNAKYIVLQPGGFGYDGVYMNQTEPPFDDLRIRQAVAHAMDRELLRKTLQFGIPQLADSPYGPGMTVHQKVPNYPKYDLAKAKSLVAAYGKPVTFTLQFNNSPGTLRLAQSLQEMWGLAGMKVELQPVDQNRIVQNMSSKQFVASLYRFTGRADPHINTYPFFHSKFADVTPSSNYGHYKNPKVDELLDLGVATVDPAKRKAIYGELAQVLAQDLPYAYLFYVADNIVITRKVKGLPAVPDGLVRFADMWLE
ncbi:ABC transporter substrate-binding protein [Vineibacter terrae]|uniref:ABC transporter substrate-binding protein n=1 Tax=Vineibacter terrae TaxID=2586908 RepID=UPI002E32CA05|nr:ABC transporter substrate-binding protein [Vineibacter terrae]HEX2890541.1 ABC transporter substrate-binding protein [Vineibacter terrae]